MVAFVICASGRIRDSILILSWLTSEQQSLSMSSPSHPPSAVVVQMVLPVVGIHAMGIVTDLIAAQVAMEGRAVMEVHKVDVDMDPQDQSRHGAAVNIHNQGTFAAKGIYVCTGRMMSHCPFGVQDRMHRGPATSVS